MLIPVAAADLQHLPHAVPGRGDPLSPRVAQGYLGIAVERRRGDLVLFSKVPSRHGNPSHWLQKSGERLCLMNITML